MKPDTHPDDLLAWYVNGTLDGAERGAVETHLRACQRCRDEVTFLGALRQGVKATGTVSSPGELGWMRLRRDARAQTRASRFRWQPALAAAAAVLIVLQAAILVNFWPREAPITPLGATKPDGIVLQVRFRPNATEAHIRELLQQTGGTLIDGPGALGVYRVRIVTGADASNSLAKLNATKDVVAHAVAE
jgi:anti-sigma factor RsiW